MRHVIGLVTALCVIGCSGASRDEGHDETTISSPEVQRELLSRWNSVVDARWSSVVAENPGVERFDFHWTMFEQFPHPTYIGEGTDEGYRAFAQLLLAFLEDNFDYLAEHQLFDRPLAYEFESGDSGGTWTFRELVDMLSDSDSWADEPTRSGLEEITTRIEELD